MAFYAMMKLILYNVDFHQVSRSIYRTNIQIEGIFIAHAYRNRTQIF